VTQPGVMSFEEWVAWVFDNPEGYPWMDRLVDWGEIPSPVLVGYLTRLFEQADGLLRSFTDAQISQSFWLLLGQGTEVNIALVDPAVPRPDLVSCHRSMIVLFERCFAPRCGPYLSHLCEGSDHPLNGLCYMWWDLFPTWGSAPGASGPVPLDSELLGVMTGILALDSVACQESALHGLGHWSLHHPDRTAAIIDGFLACRADLRPELRRYAESARAGCVN